MSIQTVHKQHLVRACVISALKRQIFHAFAWTTLQNMDAPPFSLCLSQHKLMLKYKRLQQCSLRSLVNSLDFLFIVFQVCNYNSISVSTWTYEEVIIVGKSKNLMIWGRGAFWRRWRRIEMHYFNPATCFYLFRLKLLHRAASFPHKHSLLVKTKLKPAAGLGPGRAHAEDCTMKVCHQPRESFWVHTGQKHQVNQECVG